MKLKELIGEELDTKRLKFEVEQMLAHIENQEKMNMQLQDENKRLKDERLRAEYQTRRNKINTNFQLRNKPTNPNFRPTQKKPVVNAK